MSIKARALPVNQPSGTEPLLSAPWHSADSSLAGTGGSLLGLGVLPHRQLSRRHSLDDRTSGHHAARKSVSFSLRARGPGPAYNSPSPDQQPVATQLADARPGQQDAPDGTGAAADVARRLFRSVQGYASSPEPQPKAYPGRVPQPQQVKGAAWLPGPVPYHHPAPTAAAAADLGPGPPDREAWAREPWTDTTSCGIEAERSIPSLDARALDRLRLAMSCATRVDGTYRRDSHLPDLTANAGSGGSRAFLGGNFIRPHHQLYRAAATVMGYGAASQYGAQPVQQHPTSWRPQPTQRAAATAGPGQPASPQGANQVPLLPASAAEAVWDARQDPPRAATGATFPQPTLQGPRPAGGPASHPATTAASAPGAAASKTATVAEVAVAKSLSPDGSRVANHASSPVRDHAPPPQPAQQQQWQQDDSATFEQVHLLLASLNLLGLGSGADRGEADPLNGDAAGGAARKEESGDSCVAAVVAAATATAASGTESSVGLHRIPTQAANHSAASLDTSIGVLHAATREARGACLPSAGGVGGGPPATATNTAGLAGSRRGGARSTRNAGGFVLPTKHSGAARTGADLDAVYWPFDKSLAARSPGGPRARGASAGCEGFSHALGPACRAWLRSVGRVASRQQQQQRHERQVPGGMDELGGLALQLREAQQELRHVEAYLLGMRLGVARPRLARLQALAAASGAPPAVATALLSQLEERLRLKLSLRVLRKHAAAVARLADLLRSRHEAGGPLALAAWQCWRRAAAGRVGLRGRVDAMAAARRRLHTARMLLAWRATAERAAQLRQLGADLAGRVRRRAAGECLRAWRAACERGLVLSRAHRAYVALRSRRALLTWRDAARRVAHLGQLRAQAEAHRRSRLLLASLAHWRFLHVSRAVTRVWESALARRRGLQLLARALRVWHFYARRCRQLIRQLAGQRAAAAAGVMPVVDEGELPAPLALAAVPALIQRRLAAARTYMLAMSDELLHLRGFLRFRLWSSTQITMPGRVAAEAAGAKGPAGAIGPRLPACIAPLAEEEMGVHERLGSAGDGGRFGSSGGGGTSPLLLISGQWRHKRQVLVLLAQLRQVERLEAEVEGQLEEAERNGRLVRLGLQQQADDIQRRTAASRDQVAAARAQEQALEADLEQVNKEAGAVEDYLDRCRAASASAAEQLREREVQLAEAEAKRGVAQAAAAEALAREASIRQTQLEKQAEADEAARRPPHPSFARAQQAERQGRERLLAAQRRLSEALALKAALMTHWREMQVAAAAAPHYAVQRHALRVAEAQQQVVEAAKVVSLAELEVHDLLTAVERLQRATQETRADDDQLREAAAAAAARAAEAAVDAADAAREAAAAASEEQRAAAAVAALARGLQQLREATAAELPQTATQQQSVLLGPLRAREEAVRREMEACRGRVEEGCRELQEALAAAATLSQQVEAAEVAYRAQLLRLQPTRARLQQSAQRLRSRLDIFPSELVRQLRRVVDENDIEASQDAQGNWTVGNLPPEWATDLRPGRLFLVEATSDDESHAGADDDRVDCGGPVSRDALASRHCRGDSPLRAAAASTSTHPQSLSDGTSASAWTGPLPADSPFATAREAAAAATGAASGAAAGGETWRWWPPPSCNHQQAAAVSHDGQQRPSRRASQASTQQLQLHHQHHHSYTHLPEPSLDPSSMSAAQLSRLARSVLRSAALRGLQVDLGDSPASSARRTGGVGDGCGSEVGGSGAATLGTASDSGLDAGSGGGGSSSSASREEQQRSSPSAATHIPEWALSPRSAAARGLQDAAGLSSVSAGGVDGGAGEGIAAGVTAVQAGGGGVRRRAWDALELPQAASLPMQVLSQASIREQTLSLGGSWCEQPQLPGRGMQSAAGREGAGGAAADSAARAAQREPSVSPETRRLICLLEGALGQELPAARHLSVGARATAGGDRRAQATGSSRVSSSFAVGSVRSGLSRSPRRSSPHLEESVDASPRPAAMLSQSPSDGQPACPGEYLPVRRQATAGGGFEEGKGAAALARAPIAGRGAPGAGEGFVEGDESRSGTLSASISCTWEADGATSEVAEPVADGVEGRVFSSASSLYAHQYSNLSHVLALRGAAYVAPQARAPPSRVQQSPPLPPPSSLPQQKQQHLQQQPLIALEQGQDHLHHLGLVEPSPTAGMHTRLMGVVSTLRGSRHISRDVASTVAGGEPGAVAGADAARASAGASYRLDDAASLFYRGRLCHRTLRGFQQYAASLACLALRLLGIAGASRMRWAFSHWRSRSTEPQALAAGASRATACRRCLRRWRSYACERRRRAALLELGRQRRRQCTLRACLLGWLAWCGRKTDKRRAAACAREYQLRSQLRRWRHGVQVAQERRVRKVAARDLFAQATCRRCLEHWLRAARARRLLCRVFARAELLWDERDEPSTHFGGEFDAMRRAFDQLSRYRQYRLGKRSERINEMSALAFRTSLLRVRVFAGWQAAMASAWQERYVRRRVARLLRAWRRLAHEERELPWSLCNLRRRLRVRGYPAGEADVRRQWLLRSSLAALAGASEDSWRHYTRSLLSRAVRSWRLALAEVAALVQRHRCRILHSLLRSWHAAAVWWSTVRRACVAFVAWRNRRVAFRGVLPRAHSCILGTVAATLWNSPNYAQGVIGHQGHGYIPPGAQRGGVLCSSTLPRRLPTPGVWHSRRSGGLSARPHKLLRSNGLGIGHVSERTSSASAGIVLYRRRLAGTSLAAWGQFVVAARVQSLFTRTARLHYERGLARRVLRHVSDYIREAQSAAIAHDAATRLRRCMLRWRAQALSTRAKTEALRRTLVTVDAGVQPACEPGPQGGLLHAPSAVTVSQMPAPSQPARHRADCAVTAAPARPALDAGQTYQQLPASPESTAGWDSSPSSAYRMHEVVVSAGRVAQVLVLDPRQADATSVLPTTLLSWGAASSGSHACNDENSSPSCVSLHDLPSDVSSMDRPTLQMWRKYAAQKLAEEWRRRQLLLRTLSGWLRCTARSSFVNRWKSRNYVSNSRRRGGRG